MGGLTMRALLGSGVVRCKQAFERVLGKCISVSQVPSRRRWTIKMTVPNIDDVPARIPKRRAYLVAVSKLEKWLVFDCPCNSGHQIMLNLDPSRLPCWKLLTLRDQRITVSPSVDYGGTDRRCHFLLQRGRVIWIKDAND